jgi:hypothetical protein
MNAMYDGKRGRRYGTEIVERAHGLETQFNQAAFDRRFLKEVEVMRKQLVPPHKGGDVTATEFYFHINSVNSRKFYELGCGWFE